MYQLLLILLFVTATISQWTHAEQKSHDAHVHGQAVLNIAVDANALVVEFESPSMNIVGFEHQPSNKLQRDAVKNAIEILNHPDHLLSLAQPAACKHESTTVESSMAVDDDHHEEQTNANDSDEHGYGDDHSDDHGDETSVHSEFMALWTYHCDNPAALDRIGLMLLNAYPQIEVLDVNIITPTLQTSLQMHPGETRIELN